MPTKRPLLALRDPVIEAALAQRTETGESASLTLKTLTRRYFDALTREQGGLGLSGLEWDTLQAATLTRKFGDSGPYHLHYSVLDAQAAGELPEGVDVTALVNRLRNLTPMQELAAVDLLEGWRRGG